MIDWSAGRIAKAFSALSHRNYRLMWTGTLVSNTGDWMDQVALNWLVVSTTGSAFHLALVNLCRGLPILLFVLVGGAMADRLPRRRLMMLTQSAAMALATFLAVMVIWGGAPIWAILLVATGRGIFTAFNMPVRHSLISELVPKSDLPNAIALHSMTVNLTKIIGPALAGLIIGTLGTGVCFALNAVSFIVVIRSLQAMRFPPDPPRAPSQSLGRSILEGITYVRGERTVLLLVMIALVPTFFGQPYLSILTLFAHDVFRIGPEGLGILMAFAAGGSVLGALLLASFPALAASGWWMTVFLIGFGAVLLAFAASPYLMLAPLLLFAAGAFQIAYNATNNTILQMRVPNDVRGRVISILMLNRGLVQLGTAATAGVAGMIGPRWAMAGNGLVILLLGAFILLRERRVTTLTGNQETSLSDRASE
ncbi:MFS transporter [Neorhizobium sp. T786]|uniref:MFS transporter n=1 Tax=Pseudorhizobium xiangyangii TaxID=2883104 RepID=UPI001D0019D3|nr:MFS transporter [Neorhizobium xiangyangii]MCB5204623.1 MFS transporter [Neorhizobium xiangyangii]